MNIIDSFIEVKLRQPGDFLKVRETLSRIGVASRTGNTLYQSCHILHKQGKYFIVHFKELFLLDGKPSDFSEDDKARRNTIAKLLAEWELVDLVDLKKINEPQVSVGQIKIIAYKDKTNWNLVHKYNIGKRKGSREDEVTNIN
jgi:hypothetical protein